MYVPLPYSLFQNRPKRVQILVVGLLGLIIANMGLDYLFTQFRSSAFYISESLLFSGAYWILFPPFLLILFSLINRWPVKCLFWVWPASIMAFHLLAYPALVWILSKTLYEHTFPYGQTFSYSLSSYFLKTAIIYGGSMALFLKQRTKHLEINLKHEAAANEFISSLLVPDGPYKKIKIAVNEIHYFSANPPYVNIHQYAKKYLYPVTLKSLEAQLDGNQFFRIHKSFIVNLSKVEALQSRQNGDYDITLTNGTILRVSRHYAKEFKLLLPTSTPLG